MLSRVLGNAQFYSESKLIEEFLSPGERVEGLFKVWRDEVVVTNFGLYSVNVTGAIRKRTNFEFVTKSEIIGVDFFPARTFSASKIVIHQRNGKKVKIEVRKKDQEKCKEFLRIVKDLIKSMI